MGSRNPSNGDRGTSSPPPPPLPLPSPLPELRLHRLPRRRVLLRRHPLRQGRGSHREALRDRPRREPARGGGALRANPPARARERGAHRARVAPLGGDRRVLGRVRGAHRPGVAREAPSAVVRGALRPHPRLPQPHPQQARPPRVPGRAHPRAPRYGRRPPRAQALGHPLKIRAFFIGIIPAFRSLSWRSWGVLTHFDKWK